MNYPVDTTMRLRAVLRALRQTRSLTQEQTGKLLGVNQRRAAKIESNPGVTGFAQISRLVSALGARLVVETGETGAAAPKPTVGAITKTRAGKNTQNKPRDEW
jgi:transcriptional regulator with XRE-family HTH domain